MKERKWKHTQETKARARSHDIWRCPRCCIVCHTLWHIARVQAINFVPDTPHLSARASIGQSKFGTNLAHFKASLGGWKQDWVLRVWNKSIFSTCILTIPCNLPGDGWHGGLCTLFSSYTYSIYTVCVVFTDVKVICSCWMQRSSALTLISLSTKSISPSIWVQHPFQGCAAHWELILKIMS